MRKSTIKLVVYAHKGEWRWKIINRNGQNVACGGTGYKRKSDCKRGVIRLITALSTDKFDIALSWYEW